MLDVTVCIGTFGHIVWALMAGTVARPSAEGLGVPVIHYHSDTLSIARNSCAVEAETEWLCFLDADDELEPGYFNLDAPHVDVIEPRVRYVREGESGDPTWQRVVGHRHIGECNSSCLSDGNFIIVGAPVRRSLFERVGGFRDLPVYEDYDLWVRCWRAGARFGLGGMVYRAHVNPEGRNHGLTAAERRAVQDAIVGGD